MGHFYLGTQNGVPVVANRGYAQNVELYLHILSQDGDVDNKIRSVLDGDTTWLT